VEQPRIILKDSTMREGLDVPGVQLDVRQKGILLQKLAETGVPEAELVAPGHFDRDILSLKEMERLEPGIRVSGLIYGYGTAWRNQIKAAKGVLDRVDILMPLSDVRPPVGPSAKARQMKEVLHAALDSHTLVGAGFPHATQVAQDFVVTMCLEASHAGAQRITLYDTNGGSDPWAVADLIQRIRTESGIEICFHAHNDLGMATANSIAAVRAGAGCLDVTVNGLGDRAGNASLEQVAMALHILGFDHGLHLNLLRDLSRMVEAMSLVPVPKLAPIVGEFVFRHKSPSHLHAPELFEPFDPALIGAGRSISKD